MSKQHPICDCGKPMIPTMAFRSNEYWCWNCNHKEPMFCSVEKREISDVELKELEEKIQESADYRSAMGSMYGGGQREIDGKIISFNEFPEALKEKMRKDEKSWSFSS